jgi:hypothetical protein
MNNKQLPHADVLRHMADHGFKSVEYISGICADGELIKCYADERINPLASPELPWRLKSSITPLHIDDFPMPETEAPAFKTHYYALFSLGFMVWDNHHIDFEHLSSGLVYIDENKRDKANELLIAALRGGK